MRWAALICIMVAGCHPLPPGSLDRVRMPTNAPRVGTVYLVRGWRDLYSSGIDALAKELQDAGVNATVFRAAQWRDLASAIALSPDQLHREPLVLVGFSYGADDALRIAQQLKTKGIGIDLAITIDPVTPPPVPASVKQCVNFYQPNGIWDIFPWLRGIPLTAESAVTSLQNQNLRTERKDLLETNTSHATIAANPKLHREIIGRILEICRPRPSTLYTTAPARDNAGQ